jgi:demethylmenaquinone methyltransferase / 2-methoxy-6-polyprenyl-1,4-benzoquinol methylase
MTSPEVSSATGAQPEGAHDERSAASAVREMFDLVAPRYDLLNHLLSMNIDRLWWSRTARRFRAVLGRPEARILDLCCGTGDMTMALLKHRPHNAQPILAVDFAHQMLLRGAAKFASSKSSMQPAIPIEADALRLPLPAASLDLLITAFGFRNLANYQSGLKEFYRVLKPQGELGILDFGEPGGLWGRLYALYFRRVLPTAGSLISGVPGAYQYLPSSVHKFPRPAEMLTAMEMAGFRQASWTPYNFGVAGLYRGVKQ